MTSSCRDPNRLEGLRYWFGTWPANFISLRHMYRGITCHVTEKQRRGETPFRPALARWLRKGRPRASSSTVYAVYCSWRSWPNSTHLLSVWLGSFERLLRQLRNL